MCWLFVDSSEPPEDCFLIYFLGSSEMVDIRNFDIFWQFSGDPPESIKMIILTSVWQFLVNPGFIDCAGDGPLQSQVPNCRVGTSIKSLGGLKLTSKDVATRLQKAKQAKMVLPGGPGVKKNILMLDHDIVFSQCASWSWNHIWSVAAGTTPWKAEEHSWHQGQSWSAVFG